ncbi:hypothetical protein Y032_0090g2351 [Ancylostoma ceylanicum]|uniref:Uncharacterized protein n=1 Tax=Ancylostoma ceylanicum TaxID=53326 RepID=A0A016TND9_9BILA|nr:hypothetical protein Y032_0090g2351 [Ancylostoma ceylanicum]
MNFLYFLLAFVAVAIQRSQASFPFASFFDHPVVGFHEIPHSYPYVSAVAAPAPVVHAAVPAPAYPFGFPYAPYSWYHPHPYYHRMALRNIAKSFSREKGHLSATSIISPMA